MRQPSLKKRVRASGTTVYFANIGGRQRALGTNFEQAKKRFGELLQEYGSGTKTISLGLLIEKYLEHAGIHYRKHGQQTSEIDCINSALRFIDNRSLRADEFGPRALKSVRNAMIDAGLARTTINNHVGRIRRMFRWGVSEELISATVSTALESLAGLGKGRTEAREPEPISPVDDGTVESTIQHLPSTVADMVRFQQLTGCRPSEVCSIRPCDIDMTSDEWKYIPAEHKTEHHDRQRVIFIGPRAQNILRLYLERDNESYCFVPAESEKKRLATRHEARKIAPGLGNAPGTNRTDKPKRTAGKRYTTASYRRAIERACDKAFPAPAGLSADELNVWKQDHCWAPNRLRHTTATKLRKQFGLEAAQVVLGHSMADVTQIYAERDWEKAAAIAKAVG